MKNSLFLISALVVIVFFNPVYAVDEVTPQSSSPVPGSQGLMSEKEAAFKKFYKRDPACDSFKDDNMMDRCRHAYLTAKQEFDKIWAARKEAK